MPRDNKTIEVSPATSWQLAPYTPTPIPLASSIASQVSGRGKAFPFPSPMPAVPVRHRVRWIILEGECARAWGSCLRFGLRAVTQFTPSLLPCLQAGRRPSTPPPPPTYPVYLLRIISLDADAALSRGFKINGLAVNLLAKRTASGRGSGDGSRGNRIYRMVDSGGW